MIQRKPHRVGIVASFILSAMIAAASTANAQGPGQHLLLAHQDEVKSFDLGTGKGFQTGTATGRISGTTYVDFQFIPLGPPDSSGSFPIAFENKVIITDLDGHQLYFDNNGTGTFHLGIPGGDFRGSGGPLRGTYVLTGATGKYQQWRVGSVYTYRAVATNPPNGTLGNVYVEVSFRGNVGQR